VRTGAVALGKPVGHRNVLTNGRVHFTYDLIIRVSKNLHILEEKNYG
jgi:hypothetical protein